MHWVQEIAGTLVAFGVWESIKLLARIAERHRASKPPESIWQAHLEQDRERLL